MSRRKAFFYNEKNNVNIEHIIERESSASEGDDNSKDIRFKNSLQYDKSNSFVSDTNRSGYGFNNLNKENSNNANSFSINQIENNNNNSRYLQNEKKLNNFLKFSHMLNNKKHEHITFKDLIETKNINQEEAKIKASVGLQENDTDERLAYLMAEIDKPKLKPMEIFFYNGEMLKNKNKKTGKSKKSNKFGLEDIKINEIQNVFINNNDVFNFNNFNEETPTGMDLDDYYKNIQEDQKQKEIDKNCIIF